MSDAWLWLAGLVAFPGLVIAASFLRLDVERLRLGDKLRLEIAVTPEAQSVPIPILSLQPLVENAVKHGIAPQASGGLIQIRAELDAAGALLISVRDSGPGFSKTHLGDRTGVGLENVERRLELCYGGEARLTIESSPAGTEVCVRIPAASAKPVISAAGDRLTVPTSASPPL